MLRKVQFFIDKHQLLVQNKAVLVTVSGGADSVALLHLLHSLGYKCIIAHCNFHLRGRESDRDELFVVELSSKYQLPIHRIDFDTLGYARKQGISIEMAARDLRYGWFRDLMKQTNAQAIAVAHHTDDSVETMLINLIRGTGLRGLTGISCKSGDIVRPLLNVSRKNIENYLKENGLDYVVDSTNEQSDYHRNKIRNKVLPLLEEINPSVRQTLYDSLERFDETYQLYSAAVDDIIRKVVDKDGDEIKINLDALKLQPAVNTVLFEILYPYGFNAEIVKQIALSVHDQSGKLFFSDDYQLLKDRKELILTPRGSQDNSVYYINVNDSEITNPIHFSIKKIEKTTDFQLSKENNIVHVDFAKLKFPLKLRHWKEGDVFQPFGMRGRKKLSDFFTDIKLNRIEKEQHWLLLSGDDVVWVVGQRLDNRFRVKEKTQFVLEFRI